MVMSMRGIGCGFRGADDLDNSRSEATLDAGDIMGDGSCLCEPSEALRFPCSGASNLGQIANEAAMRLREAGKGTMYCTAGIGGHVPGLVDGARTAKMLVGIDGRSVQCVRSCLEAEGLSLAVHTVVSEESEIEKGFKRPTEDEVLAILDIVDGRMKMRTNL